MKFLSLMPLLAAGIGIVSCNSPCEIPYEIVPTPKTMTAGRGSFLINDNTLISLPDSALFNEAGFLSDYIAEETGKRLAVAVKPVSEKEVSIDIDKNLPEEGYELTIGSDGVSIRGGSAAGVFSLLRRGPEGVLKWERVISRKRSARHGTMSYCTGKHPPWANMSPTKR